MRNRGLLFCNPRSRNLELYIELVATKFYLHSPLMKSDFVDVIDITAAYIM